MLHSRRRRLQALAEAEARGESFWTEEFDERVRNRLLHAMSNAAGPRLGACCALARGLILVDEGLLYLINSHLSEVSDFEEYVRRCDDDMVPTVIEAVLLTLRSRESDWSIWGASAGFAEEVRVFLREHRVSYDLVEDRIVEFSSQEMHQAVVAPTLRLLSGRAGHDSAERAYRDALDEISRGKPSDAITDAGTALQSLLTELGCSGNALGPLIKSAKAKGLLASHDGPMLDAVEKLMHWVSADRSTTGDAHAVTTPSVDDAWLIVHIVGALILRLVGPGLRGEGTN
jgi:hypothetical protein